MNHTPAPVATTNLNGVRGAHSHMAGGCVGRPAPTKKVSVNDNVSFYH
jgi:hypothetical protein